MKFIGITVAYLLAITACLLLRPVAWLVVKSERRKRGLEEK